MIRTGLVVSCVNYEQTTDDQKTLVHNWAYVEITRIYRKHKIC